MVCTTKELLKKSKKFPQLLTHPIEIYDGLFLVPPEYHSLEKADRFNHSCDPNAGIKGQILLVARRKIRAGEEICFDYETAEIGKSDGTPFYCNCGSKSCRKKINGLAWKSPSFRRKNSGFLSWFIDRRFNKR